MRKTKSSLDYTVWDEYIHLNPKPISFLCGPSHFSIAHARFVAEWRSLSSPAIWLLKCDVTPPSLHFSASHLAAHVRLSSSHSCDWGVRAAPAPARPWINVPCHYSVVPLLCSSTSGSTEPAWRLVWFNHRPCLAEPLHLWLQLFGKWCGSRGLVNFWNWVFCLKWDLEANCTWKSCYGWRHKLPHHHHLPPHASLVQLWFAGLIILWLCNVGSLTSKVSC